MIVFTFIVPLYINALILIPKYLRSFRWIKYAFSLLILILAISIIRATLTVLYLQLLKFDFNIYDEFIKWLFRDYTSLEGFIFSPTFLVILGSFAYRFIKDWIFNEQVKAKLESEKKSMELAFLKSQVNPHFLFNTLNSVYALALVENAQLTADGVAKMGSLMRYTLHDSQVEKISLKKEIDYIKNYIELQKLRISEAGKENIEVTIEVDENNDEMIAPMLLMPFIENVFKYGISNSDKIAITIKISLLRNILEMVVSNVVQKVKNIDESRIGLKNVKNRLQLIYSNRYSLNCTIKENIYIVHLKINL